MHRPTLLIVAPLRGRWAALHGYLSAQRAVAIVGAAEQPDAGVAIAANRHPDAILLAAEAAHPDLLRALHEACPAGRVIVVGEQATLDADAFSRRNEEPHGEP